MYAFIDATEKRRIDTHFRRFIVSDKTSGRI